MPPNWLDDIGNSSSKGLNLTVTIKFPKGLAGVLTVWLKYKSPEGSERYLSGSRYADGELFPIDQHGQSARFSESKDIGDVQSFSPESSGFSLEVENERSILSHGMDIQAREGKVVATVWYMPEIGTSPREDYVVELSK